MLPFFSAMSAEAHAADSLHVVARGLGSHRAAAQFIASAVDGQSLVLGLNVTRAFATGVLWPTLQGEANKGGIKSTNGLLLLPRFLNSDFSARDRACVYRGSGFIVVTAAILVHDLLHDTLPASRVSGVVIFAADAVKEKSNEHFALSLLRARNAGVFVKAFSDNAPALARGFHTAEKTMRMMYMTRLVLWPRFHQAVRKALSAHQPDLVDLAVQPSPRFNAMVAAFRDTVFAVLTDLKKVTSALDMSELYRSDGPNTDSSSRKKLVYNFDDVSRRQIQADHRHSGTRSRRVRALLADLTTLRSLLRDAFELNAVHFYQRVVTVRHAAHRGHTWLVRREAQPAVLLARSRVWVVRRRSSSTSSAAASASASVPSAGVAVGSGGDGGNSVITIDDDDDGQNKVGPATSSRTASENNQNNAETAGVRLSEDAADRKSVV